MAASIHIEVDSGVYRGIIVHRHNGYYAGSVTSEPATRTGPTRPSAPTGHRG